MATLPIGVLVCCATLSTLIAPQVIKFVSRRFLFISSSVLGIVGAGVMSFAVHDDSFLIFTIAAAPLGIAYGISNLYRFYATDSSLPENREKALAATVGGAVLSAFIGPEASRYVSTTLDHVILLFHTFFCTRDSCEQSVRRALRAGMCVMHSTQISLVLSCLPLGCGFYRCSSLTLLCSESVCELRM